MLLTHLLLNLPPHFSDTRIVDHKDQGNCDWPANVDCNDRTRRNAVKPAHVGNEQIISNPCNGSDIPVPNPNDCSSFFTCRNGVGIKQRCAWGKLFNPGNNIPTSYHTLKRIVSSELTTELPKFSNPIVPLPTFTTENNLFTTPKLIQLRFNIAHTKESSLMTKLPYC